MSGKYQAVLHTPATDTVALLVSSMVHSRAGVSPAGDRNLHSFFTDESTAKKPRHYFGNTTHYYIPRPPIAAPSWERCCALYPFRLRTGRRIVRAMKIAFHSNQLGLRGTEIALYDYALYNELLLGNGSIILTALHAPFHDARAIHKFGKRFPVYAYKDWDEAEAILDSQAVDVLYCIKAGINDGIISKGRKTVVHAVFKYCEPHGDVYAYVSEWLANHMSSADRKFPFVPHIVEAPQPCGDLREQLGIPQNAIVFGRYGGAETFDIPFVHEVVERVAREMPDRYFLFMNTNPFCSPQPNIIFVEGDAEAAAKERFIYTCDAMLHARMSGETFGLAVAEFAVRQRAVLTWTGSHERSHLELLGATGEYYDDADSLERLLRSFVPDAVKNRDVYTYRFNPQHVMQQFKSVFLA